MATTGLQTGTLPDRIINWSGKISAQRSAFLRSRAVVQDPGIVEGLSNGSGDTFRFNFWKDDNTAANTSTDDTTGATPVAISGDTQKAVPLHRNQGWSAANLTRQVGGSDPMDFIAQFTGNYWARQWDATIVSILTGIWEDNDANDSDDMIADFGEGATDQGLFTSARLNEAAHTMGENTDMLVNGGGVLIVHPVVHQQIVDINLAGGNNVVFANAIDVGFGTFQGFTLISSARVRTEVRTSLTSYGCYLLGPGSIGFGQVSDADDLEIDRRPREGTGGGTRELWSRRHYCFHPYGFDYGGAARPADTVLDDAASWDRVYAEREQVNMAFMWVTTA